MPVIRLTETMINQIAAGEVIERPASVVKELIENSIDAGAQRIDILTASGGKNLIRISDDGSGMSEEDLQLAVERHCTSKLATDLMNIATLGFRGEALPSIGSVAKLAITTRQTGGDIAWKIVVEGGRVQPIEPAALTRGTVIEVSNLFANVPARLKFLKSDRAENNAITQIFKRIALAFPHIRFSLSGEDRSSLEYFPAQPIDRISQVLGKEFKPNALEIDAGREGFRLSGFAGIPTYNRGNAQHQYFYVNGRPVQDKSLFGAVRGAYSDFLPKDRHGILVLFLDCDPSQVDVNVHPAKSDVRFRDAGLVRGLIVGALKQAFSEAGFRASTEGSQGMMAAFRTEQKFRRPSEWQPELSPYRPLGSQTDNVQYQEFAEPSGSSSFPDQPSVNQESTSATTSVFTPFSRNETPAQVEENWYEAHPLGAARAQLHQNYIVTQTPDGLVIVDQHAAHERIVYEQLKKEMNDGVAGQMLLIPEIVELPEEDVDRIVEQAGALVKFGLGLEKFGPGAVVVRETPALLGEVDCKSLILDLVDELTEWNNHNNLKDRLEHVAATIACHGSVRSGRVLKPDEMNALLRQMEITPNSGQCNHGRPTYIELKLKDIERLFGR